MRAAVYKGPHSIEVAERLEGRINPGRVLDFETDLDHVVEAYEAMDQRRAIKSLIRLS